MRDCRVDAGGKGAFVMAMSAEERRNKNARNVKRRTNRLKRLGLCIYCGTEKHMRGKVYCKSCADWISKRDKLRRDERRKKHLCTKCGKPLPADDKHAVCEECRAKSRAWSHGEKYKK